MFNIKPEAATTTTTTIKSARFPTRTKMQSKSLNLEIILKISNNSSSSHLLFVLIVAAICCSICSGVQANQEISTAAGPARLQAELDGLLQAHQQQNHHHETSQNQDNNQQQQQQQQSDKNKQLTEAIISRLMLSNLSESTPQMGVNFDEVRPASDSMETNQDEIDEIAAAAAAGELDSGTPLSSSDVARLRRLIGYMHNYQMVAAAPNSNGDQYPILPYGQAPTNKRASTGKLGGPAGMLVRGGASRQSSAYGRNNFDFGLGKRPDSSVANNILRLGDSSLGAQAGLGKRPSSQQLHRYDFGLGKRVASPTYPRYDFGLGKRAPNRLRYDFGLGRR